MNNSEGKNMIKLLEWFGKFTQISNENEKRRLEILSEMNKMTHFAISGNSVLISTPKGYCLIEKQSANDIVATWRDCASKQSERFSITQELADDILMQNDRKKCDFQSLSQTCVSGVQNSN